MANIRTKLEPDSNNQAWNLALAAQVSAAISLKRIADMLEQTQRQFANGEHAWRTNG